MAEPVSWTSPGILALWAALLLSTIVMGRMCGWFRRVSVVGTVFLTLFVMHGISAIPYTMGLVNREILGSAPTSSEFPYVLGAAFCFYALGAVTFSAVFRFNLKQAHARFFSEPLAATPPRWGALAVLTGSGLVLGALFALGTGQMGIRVLAEQARDTGALRDFRRDFSYANPYSYAGSYAKNLLLPFSTLVAINVAAATRRLRWRMGSSLLFIALLVVSAGTLMKLPVVVAVLYLLVNSFIRTTRTGVASLRWMSTVLAMILIGGFLLYYVTYDVDRDRAVEATLVRVLVTPQECLDGFLLAYPDYVPHNWGLGIGLVAKIAGLPDYMSPPLIVGKFMTGRDFLSANAFWASEMWAAFGYPGVIIGSWFVGGFVTWLDFWMLRRKRTLVTTAGYSFLVVAALMVPSWSIFTAMLTGGLALAPLVVSVLERRTRATATETGTRRRNLAVA